MVPEQDKHSKPNPTKIMVVDDHDIVRQGLSMLLDQQPDMQVSVQADNAIVALQAVDNNDIDLAIIDISLNVINGFELIRRIKLKYPKLLILVLSMHVEPYYVKRAFKTGANGYVTKNEAAENIVSAIHTLLKGQDYISEDMQKQFSD